MGECRSAHSPLKSTPSIFNCFNSCGHTALVQGAETFKEEQEIERKHAGDSGGTKRGWRLPSTLHLCRQWLVQGVMPAGLISNDHEQHHNDDHEQTKSSPGIGSDSGYQLSHASIRCRNRSRKEPLFLRAKQAAFRKRFRTHLCTYQRNYVLSAKGRSI
jgi:hypothetical protein